MPCYWVPFYHIELRRHYLNLTSAEVVETSVLSNCLFRENRAQATTLDEILTPLVTVSFLFSRFLLRDNGRTKNNGYTRSDCWMQSMQTFLLQAFFVWFRFSISLSKGMYLSFSKSLLKDGSANAFKNLFRSAEDKLWMTFDLKIVGQVNDAKYTKEWD